MSHAAENVPHPDIKLAAVCGLFCSACSLYIGTMEEPARLRAMAQRMKLPVTELECHGCRSDKRSFWCRQYCTMAQCAADKGIKFCGECAAYPCADLQKFQADRPHRIELWQAHERIKAAGYETWFQEMVEHYSCPECQTINSAYDQSCRKCGASPSCNYVRLHQTEIEKHQTAK